MRVLFFLSMLVIFSCSHKKAIVRCDKIRTGRFLLKSKVEKFTYLIERTMTWQEEYHPLKDSIFLFSIKWVNACEYEMIKISARKKTAADPGKRQLNSEMDNTVPVNVRITEVSDSFYRFEARIKGVDRVFKDTMWIAK